VREVGEGVGEVQIVDAGQVGRGQKGGEFAEGSGGFECKCVGGVECEDCFVISGDVSLVVEREGWVAEERTFDGMLGVETGL